MTPSSEAEDRVSVLATSGGADDENLRCESCKIHEHVYATQPRRGLSTVSPPIAPLPEAEDRISVPASLGMDANPQLEPCGTEEDTDVRWLKAPVKPSPEESAQHNVSHLRFPSWCRYCVRGRGRSIGHPQVDHSADQLPTMEIDYGFLGDRDSPATDLPVLAGRERQSKVVWSSPVPCKGVEDHPHGTNRLIEWLDETGYKRIVCKSDQEPAIMAVVNAAKRGWSGELIVEAAPKESHERSNSGAEITVQQVHGLSRTLKEQLKDNAQIKVPQKHCVLAWLIEYVGFLITAFAKGPDGFTAYFRLKGKHFRVALPLFGECVEFKIQTRHKLEARWAPGVFLGIRRKTTEKLIGTSDGIYVVQSVHRKPSDEAWNGDLVLSVKGSPWLPNPKAEDPAEFPLPIVLTPEMPEVPVGPPEAFDRAEVHRRMYITKADLKDPRIGYTGGCPACDETRLGKRSSGVVHTPECRDRIEKILMESNDPKHVARMNKWIAEDVAFRSKQATAAPEAPADSAEPAGIDAASRYQESGASASTDASATTPMEMEDVRSAKRAVDRSSVPARAASAPASASRRRLDRPTLKRLAEQDPDSGNDGRLEENEDCGSDPRDSDVNMNLLMEDAETGLICYLEEHRERVIASIAKKAEAEGNPRPTCDEQDPLDQDSYWEAFYDDISGKVLDKSLVQEARRTELKFIDQMNVWRIVRRPGKLSGKIVLKGRWVDVNKVDEYRPNYRSRYVAKEIKKGVRSSFVAEFFAAMPPLQGCKFLLLLALTREVIDVDGNIERSGDILVVGFMDVKRAHFVAKARREIYVELPPELVEIYGSEFVAELMQSLYGTRDASSNWEFAIRDLLVDVLGFIQGLS